jgi:hypothetical protein
LFATGLSYIATPQGELASKHAELFDPGLIATFWDFYKRQADRRQ